MNRPSGLIHKTLNKTFRTILDRITHSRAWRWIRQHDVFFRIVAMAGAMTLVLLNFEFSYLESRFYDLRMRSGSQPVPNPDIVLIEIDNKTTLELNDFAPLPLRFHAELIQALAAQEPRAIGYLINMNHVNQINPDQFSSEYAQSVLESIHDLDKKDIPFIFGTAFDMSGEVVPPYPLSAVDHAVAVIHQDGNVFSEDKVTRRALLNVYERPTFHLMLAQGAGLFPKDPKEGHIRGAFMNDEVDAQYFYFRYHGNPAKRPYKVFSAVDIARGRVDPGILKDKIILVTTNQRENPSDFATTPYSKTAFSSPKSQIHAMIVDSISKNNGIIPLPRWLTGVIAFVCAALVMRWVLMFTPLTGVVLTLGLSVVLLLVGLILFKGFFSKFAGAWLELSHPLVGLFLGYYLSVPYRLISEYKQRWDYQRKTEILTEVEDLKMKFLSLVTHDLKTPVARIQGLAEVIMRKSAERLIDRDKESLQSIVQSTEDLNRFISSILELSKLESNQLKLNIESKDVNDMVERVAEQFKAQARTKKIKFITNLEPLFPVKIDVSLITKVLNNLLDNAIKYSPSESIIELSSFEEHEHIVIAIRDQGIGMSEEEMQNLFTKFYRAKRDALNTVSGSGLGLYLSKFFVEAHHGSITVESAIGRGSTFKIYLPLELDVDQPNRGLRVERKETTHVSRFGRG